VDDAAAIAYEFTAGSGTVEGHRIGFGASGALEEVLKRYPKGAKAPVYYDPANPADCVLERAGTLPIGCVAAIALIALTFGAVVVAAVLNVAEVDAWLMRFFPPGGNPIFTLVFGGGGLLILLLLAAELHRSAESRRWPLTDGVAESSRVESYQTMMGTRATTVTF
jgi:hypothetical protein